MSKRTSPVWEHFLDDSNDYTNAICQVAHCKHPTVSRGKTGTSKGSLSNHALKTHLMKHHPKVFAEVKEKIKKHEESKSNLDDEDSEDEENTLASQSVQK